MDIKFINVLILGFGFMFVFTSFQTMGNIEVWTDYKGRIKKKISTNKGSIRQTGGGPSELNELTPLDNAVDILVNTSVAANPSGNVFGLKILPTISTETPPRVEVDSPDSSVEVAAVLPSALASKETAHETPNTSKRSTYCARKRRLQAKEEGKKKVIKLIEKQTEEMTKMTAALLKLAAAIEAQTKIIQATKENTS